MRMPLRLYISMVFILTSIMGVGQDFNNMQNKGLDSIEKLSFDELSKLYYAVKRNSVEDAEKIAKFFLNKAKQSNDTIMIADGFMFLGNNRIKTDEEELKYYDSIIDLTKNIVNHRKYPALGYLRKGGYFSKERDFKKALGFYLKAYDYASQNNPNLAFYINNSIGILRSRTEDHKKTLKAFKKSFKYAVKNDFKRKNKKTYLSILFCLSNGYRRNHILDSAKYYCDLGIKESINSKNYYYYLLLLTKGILDYKNAKYQDAETNILTAKHFY